MYYDNIVKGKFLARPNRFIACALVNGEEVLCHVKNTGRCKELLIPGTDIYLQRHNNVNRKTQYSLIAVRKGERCINIDSQAPNIVVKEWLQAGNLINGIKLLKKEQYFGDSRFDFYVEGQRRSAYIEVKGVTLEVDRIALFPDAPTQRGIKHIHELCKCIDAGFDAYIIFIIQMDGVNYFTPNIKTHYAFAKALKTARDYGVHILVLDCNVSADTLTIQSEIPVCLP